MMWNKDVFLCVGGRFKVEGSMIVVPCDGRRRSTF